MAFTDTQIKALSAKLSAKYVKTRNKAGVTLSYIEGWHAIAEANRIFGFAGWDRETVETNCVWQHHRQGQNEVAIRRECGCGSGPEIPRSPGKAAGQAVVGDRTQPRPMKARSRRPRPMP